MSLADLKINEFIHLLSTSAPAPGGGSAAGVSASLGAALCGMVSQLTIGREKYKDYEPLMLEISEEAKKLESMLLKCIDKDNAAYQSVANAYKMPKDTDEQKKHRSDEILRALKYATEIPFELIELSYKTLLLTERAVGKSNANAVSDLGASALFLKAAVQTGWLNVLINVSLISDKSFASDFKNKSEEYINKTITIADRIYSETVNIISG